MFQTPTSIKYYRAQGGKKQMLVLASPLPPKVVVLIPLRMYLSVRIVIENMSQYSISTQLRKTWLKPPTKILSATSHVICLDLSHVIYKVTGKSHFVIPFSNFKKVLRLLKRALQAANLQYVGTVSSSTR